MSSIDQQSHSTDPSSDGLRPSLAVEPATVLPLEVIDKAIGTQIKVLLTNNKEFHGKLVGFDDFVNVVLEDVQEVDAEGQKGKTLKKMLLNGTQIAMLCPSS